MSESAAIVLAAIITAAGTVIAAHVANRKGRKR
jgi:hypothetical protein